MLQDMITDMKNSFYKTLSLDVKVYFRSLRIETSEAIG